MKRAGAFHIIFAVFILAVITMPACSQAISQQQAEENAVTFIKSRVKFFAKEESTNSSKNVSQAAINRLTSYR